MFGKKRLFNRMQGYVGVVQMAFYQAIVSDDPKVEKRIAACAANFMVGQSSPDHDGKEQSEGREIAARILRRRTDIRHASAQCLRTMATIRGVDEGPEMAVLYLKSIEWVNQFGDLPKDTPNPDSMQQLAHRLGTQYGLIESD